MTESPQDLPAEGGPQPYSGQPSSGGPAPQPPPPPASSYQPPAYGVAPAPVSVSEARMWALLANLSGFLFYFVGPLVIYLIYKDRDPFIRRASAQALNFQIVVAIAGVIGAVLTATLILAIIGIPLLIAVGVCWIVFPILAAVAANRGENYDYPLVPQMVS